MSAEGPESASPKFERGFSWKRGSADDFNEVLDAAFDYRGDVTIELKDGARIKGYLANRNANASPPFFEVFPDDGGPKRRFVLDDLSALEFSGKDTASGKSWETWIAKWNAKKESEARGEAVGDIGLYPDPLD